MTSPAPSRDRELLAELRGEIDAIDAEMVRLLARRMAVVERVIVAKRHNGIPAFLPERVEDVVARVRAQAEANGVPPDLVEVVWRAMMDRVIAYEEERLG